MSTNEPSKAEVIAKSIEKISDSKGLQAIGDGLGVGLVVFGFAAMAAAMFFSVHWDGHLYEQKQCYEIQEIKGKPFKVNTCTGDIEELNIDTSTD